VVVQVGAFNEHPPKNSMASFSFTITVLDKGTTLVFGSWICIANGSGGFNVHLANSRKPEPSTPNRCSNLDKFVNNLDELLLPDHTEEIERMSVFNATSTHAAPELLRSDLIQSVDLHTRFPFGLRNTATVYLKAMQFETSPHWRRTWIVYSRSEMTAPTTTRKLLVRVKLRLLLAFLSIITRIVSP
jgi:hypothetical protein